MSMMEYHEREQERLRLEALWPKNEPLRHLHLRDPEINMGGTPDNPVGSVMHKLLAEVADRTDEVFVQAIIREAERAGVNDLYLIDREYILDALRLKRVSEKRPKIVRCKDCKSYSDGGKCRKCNLWRDAEDFCSRGEKKEAEK